MCTGNICRSPIAERLASTMGSQLGIPRFEAVSAGTRALVGHPMHRHAATVLDELGGSGLGFAARRLTPRIVSRADLVLVMTREHRDVVLECAPHKLHRTFTLVEAARLASECGAETVVDLAGVRPQLTATDSFDIPDPIGQPLEVFATVGQLIADHLTPVLELCQRSVDSSE
ncbi:low molecular weight phosphatase family protein [Mycolicibacterium vanbaalenii]|uniref:arsenate reductase/protein-tyrosine-phosphatase family protein n=1 Tax=Mycolicibacterium vanbaalenii TaxID=110539 RepID=UPI0030B91888